MLFLGLTWRISQFTTAGLFHYVPRETNFSLHSVVFGEDAFEGAHLVGVASERSLDIMKLNLEIAEGRRCRCCCYVMEREAVIGREILELQQKLINC